MANNKLRLTYLWADQDVLRLDLRKKVSQGMTEWAKTFYSRYGLGLDVDPPAGTRMTATLAKKYALEDSGGIQPDLREHDEIVAANSRELKIVEEQIEARKREYDAATERTDVDGMKRAWTAWMKLEERSLSLRDRNSDLVMRSRSWIYDLREALTRQFILEGVGDPKRLSVVFCSFQLQSRMRMRGPDRGTTGLTLGFPSPAVKKVTNLGSLLLWPYPFVVIDLRGHRRNVAHEVVHGAGHGHPDDFLALQSVDKRYGGRRAPRPSPRPARTGGGSLSPDYDDPAFEIDESGAHYEVLAGGFIDGPPNDLMNYTIDDPDPAEVNLRREHQDLLEASFFVR